MLCTAATVLFVLALISDTSAYTFPAMAAPLLRLVQQHYFYRGQSHQNHHNLALHSAPTQRLATDRFSSSGVVRLETFEVGSGYDTNINRRKKSRSVNSAEKSRQLERILKALRGAKVSISLTEMNHAITAAGRGNRINEAMEIFEAIPRMGFEPDLMSYNNIIWCAGNSGRLETAKKLFAELRKRNMRANVYTYGAMMHGFAKVKNYRQALAYLDKMEEDGITPNQIVFTSAMEACAEGGNYKEALRVMQRMENMGLKADITMINTAIKACSLAGAMDEAEKLADILRGKGTMDLFTYHTLMMGHTKLGRYQRVLVLYDEATQSNAKLDGGVYSLAMLAALSCGLPAQVPRIADKAREQKIQLTMASYTILIQAYAEAGGVDQAEQCLDVMQLEGLMPNVITYAAAVAACRDRPQKVLALLERMRNENIEANTIVLTSAINALARAGGNYTADAYQMLLSMEKDGPEPNIYTYNTVTRAFAEVGRLDEAMEVLQTIKKRNLTPDRYTFTTLLMACGRTNSSEKVDYIMTIMKQAGVVPDKISYGAAMDAHRRAGNSLKAMECLQEMYKNKIEPSAAHYNLVLRTLRAEGLVDTMYKMVLSISRKDDININGNTFELAIEALLEANMWKEAMALVAAMDKRSFCPSINSCVQLVEQLEKARQYKAVLALYQFMVRNGYDFYENSLLDGIFKRLLSMAATGSGVRGDRSSVEKNMPDPESIALTAAAADLLLKRAENITTSVN